MYLLSPPLDPSPTSQWDSDILGILSGWPRECSGLRWEDRCLLTIVEAHEKRTTRWQWKTRNQNNLCKWKHAKKKNLKVFRYPPSFESISYRLSFWGKQQQSRLTFIATRPRWYDDNLHVQYVHPCMHERMHTCMHACMCPYPHIFTQLWLKRITTQWGKLL